MIPLRLTKLVCALSACCLCLGASIAPVRADKVVLRWEGKNHSPEVLPENFPETARATVAFWAPWCETYGYRMDLEDRARVLLITPNGSKARRRQVRLVERVLTLFEGEFKAPERDGESKVAGASGSKEAEKKKPPVLPEDPEESEHPWDVHGERGLKIKTTRTTWGAEHIALDHDPAVFVIPTSERHYVQLLDHLSASYEHMAAWADVASLQQGFVVSWPLTTAYLERPDGVEEWSPNNELVNRLGRLLFLRRFGRQPYWAELGVGWHMEVELLGGVYVFPYRNEFVWAVEHAAWPSDLKRRFEERKKDPLQASEFCDLKRGTYRPLESRLSFGFMDFLAREGDPALPAFFEDLRLRYEEKSVIKTGPYTWERDPEYEVPPDEQAELLRQHFGDDIFERASGVFRTGVGKKRAKTRTQ